MQLTVDIRFDQLVQLAKQLPKAQWKQLKDEVEQEKPLSAAISDMEELLFSAPTFSQKQLDEIEKTRKAINQWRTK